MELPTFFRRLFTGIYAAITFTFVCTVAYAATMGAFGTPNQSEEAGSAIDCETRLKDLEHSLTTTALECLQPYQTSRLPMWSEAAQGWIRALNTAKASCSEPHHRRRIKAMSGLQQAYANAILGFEARAQNAISTLESLDKPKK